MKDIQGINQKIEGIQLGYLDMHRSQQDEILERRWQTKQIWALGLIDILVIVLVGWMFFQIRKLTSHVSNGKIRIGGEDGAHNKKEYDLLDLIISSNQYTDVYKGIFQGKKRAIKRLHRSHYNDAVNEREILLGLDHPNVIRCYGYIDDGPFTLILLELCNCDLNDLVEELSDSAISGRKSYVRSQLKEKYHLWEADGCPSKDLIDLIWKIVYGLEYLHQNRIIHRDLKPANVLIQIVKEDMVPKLSDMGISKLLIDESSVSAQATDYGTSGWKAPELLLHDRHSTSADMFSLGCLIFFCLTKGNHPFGDASQRDENIRNDNADTFVIEDMPEAHDLVNKLLKHSPDERLNAEETSGHPFFWELDKRMAFIAQVSDTIKAEGRNGKLESLVEKAAPKVFQKNWNKSIPPTILSHLRSRGKYSYSSLSSLLRLLRNAKSHFSELAVSARKQNIKRSEKPDDLYKHFFKQFPNLFMEVYFIVKQNHPYNASQEFMMYMGLTKTTHCLSSTTHTIMAPKQHMKPPMK